MKKFDVIFVDLFFQQLKLSCDLLPSKSQNLVDLTQIKYESSNALVFRYLENSTVFYFCLLLLVILVNVCKLGYEGMK